MRSLGALLMLLAMLLALAGCVVLGRSTMENLDFRLRGKLAVRVEQAAFSASFDWRQAGGRYEIELWGPLGQGRIRLRGDDSALSVTDSRGKTRRGANAAALMEESLGWSVPTTALRHWVRGGYDPATLATQLSYEGGHLRTFEQLGWTVLLERWSETAVGSAPGRVVATGEGRRIVVVCRDWSRD